MSKMNMKLFTSSALLVDDLLSVVDIGEDGTSFLKPLKITDTHVVVDVPHLSALGIVVNRVRRFLSSSRKIKSQVQLFLRREPTREALDVLLLPHNVALSEVLAQQGDAKLIKTPPDCILKCDQVYSLYCEPEDLYVQPKHAPFFANYGPNYCATFEVSLIPKPERVTLTIEDKDKREAWKRLVFVTGSESKPLQENIPGPSLVLDRIQFIKGVTDTVLKQLLDVLLKHEVINDEEMETLTHSKTRAEKAREVFDTVRRKGADAWSIFHEALKENDRRLYKELIKFNK